jgi:hypothetical protein
VSKTKYKLGQFIGVGVCIVGLVFIVFLDMHASDRARGSWLPIASVGSLAEFVFFMSSSAPFVLLGGILEMPMAEELCANEETLFSDKMIFVCSHQKRSVFSNSVMVFKRHTAPIVHM